MLNAWLADAVLVFHGLFIVWAVAGGVAVLRWPALAWGHLPAVGWAVWIEASGGLCPLTPLEITLRRAAGQAGWQGGFIEHYLSAAIYPAGLTRELQWGLAAFVLVLNLGIYGWLLRRRQARRRRMA
ncbi:MAG: DUF2784 domain-containing protein [Rubrivivax sp.]|nr:DUF2784 domain-containing protein [Rubrivivax sp.]